MKALAAELKARRGDLRISQEELAARAEINRTYVGKIELASNQPTLSVLLRLADGLEVALPELIESVWAAAGFKDTLLRWSMKPEVVYGNEKEIQPRVQA